MRIAVGLLVATTWTVAEVSAENWPHWRGPRRDGSSAESGLPTRWSTTEGVKWKLALPTWSGSTPVIWGDRIFLSTASGGERAEGRFGRQETGDLDPEAQRLALWCVDRAAGTLLWKRDLGGGNLQLYKHNMSSPSPVTDGKQVFVLTGTGIVRAFDFEGTELWSRDLQADYGEFGLNWGYASSPLLYEGQLYVQVLHGMKTDEPSYLVALDPADGSTRWRVERPTDAPAESPDSYTTPLPVSRGGRTEIVVTGGDYVTGHDPATGEELWRAGGMNPGKEGNYRVIASPIVVDDLLVVPTRVKPFQVFRLQAGQGADAAARVWTNDEGPDVPSPVSDGERLYLLRDNGVMLCLDVESGAVIWGPERVRARTFSASPVLADGKIYATAEDGVTSVDKAGAAFELLAENDLGGYTLSSPAISEGQIFIRTDSHLYCIGERSES